MEPTERAAIDPRTGYPVPVPDPERPTSVSITECFLWINHEGLDPKLGPKPDEHGALASYGWPQPGIHLPGDSPIVLHRMAIIPLHEYDRLRGLETIVEQFDLAAPEPSEGT